VINLRREKYKTAYLHPRKDFLYTDVHAEMRYDPLTGDRVRIHEIDWRTRKIDFLAMGGKSAERCPFCGEALGKKAARFHPDLCEEGHFRKGSVTLIPNILPYAENSAVAVLTAEHVVPMGAMPLETIYNGASVIMEFARKISIHDKKKYRYALLHWNYMPASGGSLIHPHMQVYVTDTPLNYHRRVLENAKEFQEKNSAGFFESYIDLEKKEEERFIAQRGRCSLILPFASRGMLGEFLIIIESSYSYEDLTEEDLMNISSLIRDVSGFLEAKNIPGFNLALFSSPAGEKTMLNHIRIYPRVFRDVELFATDIETPTLLYGESFSLVSPESNAKALKEFLAAASK
jgi:UDPglucose--hexose-1-phosphate uridylyltransferase